MGVWRVLWLMCALAACGKADPMQGLEPGEHGRVVRVIDGDALVLDTGQSVRLIGIEAPARPYKDREGQPYHEEAKRLLEDMVLGREVQLHYAGLTRDRYDRALAHVRTTDALGPTLWLNAEMIRRGGARVRVYPDTALANAPLLELEEGAREAREGLWKMRAYRIPPADKLPDEFSGFQIVSGHVTGMEGAESAYSVCDLILVGSPLRLSLSKSAASLCQEAQGHQIRARGYVREGRMEISHPLDLELLGPVPD
ncbi:thermonuclease family protein [Hyphomonas beringensis]|nr:thermonuclease family protein [Hyphomonas beringensis]